MKHRLPFIKAERNRKPQYSRSTVAASLIVKAAGGNWLGVSTLRSDEPLALFNDGACGDILSLPMSEISMAAVRDKLDEDKEKQLSQANSWGDSDFTWEHPEITVV